MDDIREHEAELKSLVEDILKTARQQGADQAEVSASMDAGLSVSVRKGELENLEFNQDRGFGITLYVGQKKGSASTTDSSVKAIQDTVAAAKKIASFTEDDPCSGLADANLAPKELIDLDLFHAWDLETDQAVELAQASEAVGLAYDARLTNSDGVQVNTQQSLRVYGNSHGFIGTSSGTRHGLSCVLIGEDDNGMQRDYWYTVARDATELEAAEAVGEQAAQRTIERLSPRKAPTGKFPVLYSPPLASGLFSHMIGAISGGALYRRASFLLDSIGEQIFPPWLSLVERPHLAKSLGSANFDGDGVATSEKAFVENGKVASYVLGTYSARKLGLASTGNAGGVYNLDIDGPATPVDDLLNQMGEGLLITELMGQGVNSVTGDYSRGASGFWVEGGKISYPVAEVTVAGTLREMFMGLVAIGDDVDYRNNVRAPSVLLREMVLAGGG
ncbi:MAG: metalloprotease PmbA [Gammaproteobacteria bacterium]|nr:metalloprotease PmbA [Gammaproteobacteria bacterium]